MSHLAPNSAMDLPHPSTPPQPCALPKSTLPFLDELRVCGTHSDVMHTPHGIFHPALLSQHVYSKDARIWNALPQKRDPLTIRFSSLFNVPSTYLRLRSRDSTDLRLDLWRSIQAYTKMVRTDDGAAWDIANAKTMLKNLGSVYRSQYGAVMDEFPNCDRRLCGRHLCRHLSLISECLDKRPADVHLALAGTRADLRSLINEVRLRFDVATIVDLAAFNVLCGLLSEMRLDHMVLELRATAMPSAAWRQRRAAERAGALAMALAMGWETGCDAEWVRALRRVRGLETFELRLYPLPLNREAAELKELLEKEMVRE